MRAIVKTAEGPGHIELATDWPEATPGPGEVKIEIAAAGICGTDVHIVKGTWACRAPVALGHEWCGTVIDAGPGVRALRAGDRVLCSNPAKTCGLCHHCVAGNPFMCPERISAGYMIDGAFAETICIDERRCHKLPDSVSFRAAALGEPLAVAVHACIERTTVHAGDLVVVIGPGCVGLLTAQVARLEGARVVICGIDKDRPRLARARALGIEAVVNVDREDISEIVRSLSHGRGADLVYDCAGSQASLATAWEVVKKEGTLVPLGIYPGPIQTDFNKITMKELRVVGSYGYVWTTWQRTVRLLGERKIDAEGLVSHEYPLEQHAEAFSATQDGSAVKVIFAPGARAATIFDRGARAEARAGIGAGASPSSSLVALTAPSPGGPHGGCC
jgi:L-iditol 2-dehydrogenase